VANRGIGSLEKFERFEEFDVSCSAFRVSRLKSLRYLKSSEFRVLSSRVFCLGSFSEYKLPTTYYKLPTIHRVSILAIYLSHKTL